MARFFSTDTTRAGPGRKTVYTAWKKLQRGANGGYFGTGWGVTWRIWRAPRTDARVSHELRRAFRWLKSNGGHLVVRGAADKQYIAGLRKPPAHIRECILNNWDLLYGAQ